MPAQPTVPGARSHIDINDSAARAAFASRLGVSEERLRKAVRMVGSRITTLTAHLR